MYLPYTYLNHSDVFPLLADNLFCPIQPLRNHYQLVLSQYCGISIYLYLYLYLYRSLSPSLSLSLSLSTYIYSDVMNTIQCAHPPHHHNGFVATCRLWTVSGGVHVLLVSEPIECSTITRLGA